MPDAQGNPLPGEAGYVEPTTEQTALSGEGPSTTVEPTTQLDMPPLDLSDQSDTMDETRENMEGISDWALGEFEGVEKGEVGYEKPDAEELIGESGLKEGKSYIDPEGTVEKQLTDLIDSDSQYMQLAERRAKEQAASLGLAGSTMAVGAAHRAAIEQALPIAQQDAKTYAASMLEEQKTANEMSRMKAESDLSALAREHKYDIDSEMLKFTKNVELIADQAKLMGSTEAELGLTKMKLQWDAETKEHLARLDAELTMKMNQQEIDAREREYASKTSSQIMAAAYGTINDLMGNADFMAGYADNPEGLTTVFNNFINLAKDQVRFIGASAGLTEEYMDPESGYLELIGEWSFEG